MGPLVQEKLAVGEVTLVNHPNHPNHLQNCQAAVPSSGREMFLARPLATHLSFPSGKVPASGRRPGVPATRDTGRSPSENKTLVNLLSQARSLTISAPEPTPRGPKYAKVERSAQARGKDQDFVSVLRR